MDEISIINDDSHSNTEINVMDTVRINRITVEIALRRLTTF